MNSTSPMNEDRSFFGHPRPLATLFFTELWERFSFYGMKAMLFLFVTAHAGPGPQGGMGMDAETGGAVAGLYNAAVYLLALPGGWLADRLIGTRRAVMLGGIIIAAGHFAMAAATVPSFYLGLALIVVGTGLLKPSISSLVGELYEGASPTRRDAGFSVFYMGINIGAFAAPLLCGLVRERFGWHAAFGLAGIGMCFGVVWFFLGGRTLDRLGERPKLANAERQRTRRQALRALLAVLGVIALLAAADLTRLMPLSWTGVADAAGFFTLGVVALYLVFVCVRCDLELQERKNVVMIGILFLFMALFWSGFEQASTSLNAFARDLSDREILGWMMPTEFLQAVNPLFIIALSPVFGAFWIRLAARNLRPSVPLKFALGLLQLGLGFFVLMAASQLAGGSAAVSGGGDPERVSPAWLCTTYLFFTTGELCISPVGLSAVTRLSPKRFVSQMLGIWFIAAALGNLIAGRVGGLIQTLPPAKIFLSVGAIAAAAGVLLLILTPLLVRRLLPDDRSVQD